MSASHDFNRANAHKLLQLVLALQRQTQLDVPDAGHMEDILLLLRVANQEAELISWACQATGASSAELRSSCVAFIARICFKPDNDAYGVLGLNPWASADAIREHYRLLIRIFHPDRGLVSNQLAETYSARINQAYATLKLTFDTQPVTTVPTTPLRSADKALRQQPAASVRRRFAVTNRADPDAAEVLSWASGLTPLRVLSALALLAVLILYWMFPHKLSLWSGSSGTLHSQTAVGSETVIQAAQSIKTDSAAPVVLMPAEPAVDATPNIVDNARAPVVSTIAVQPSINNITGVSAPVPDKSLPAATKPASRSPGQLKVNPAASVETTTLSAQQAHPNVAAAEAVADSGGAAGAVRRKQQAADDEPSEDDAKRLLLQPAAANAEEVPSERELRELITNFMRHYANGDINGFMQVFDAQVRTDEEGGKKGLQRTYASFFAKTVSRSIVLKDLHWRQQGPLAVAVADYRATTQRADQDEATTSTGSLQIEVIKQQGRIMISGFFHQTAP